MAPPHSGRENKPPEKLFDRRKQQRRLAITTLLAHLSGTLLNVEDSSWPLEIFTSFPKQSKTKTLLEMQIPSPRPLEENHIDIDWVDDYVGLSGTDFRNPHGNIIKAIHDMEAKMVSIGTELKSEMAKSQGDLKNAIEENKVHPVFELAKRYWEYKYTMAKKRSEFGSGIGGSDSSLEVRMEKLDFKLYILYLLYFIMIIPWPTEKPPARPSEFAPDPV
ncbi:hypothetical protein B9Z19DRAFT_1137520 [Tuber borchii]|uniref:Uncharacterized protein n=1 Tax=Tuber borchii TaxID=42251 RepID=A0A2T6ZAE5_TUBBO|nr:hypothetical protein B9Z19DRAFT_1137520 [Tuber borchii]